MVMWQVVQGGVAQAQGASVVCRHTRPASIGFASAMFSQPMFLSRHPRHRTGVHTDAFSHDFRARLIRSTESQIKSSQVKSSHCGSPFAISLPSLPARSWLPEAHSIVASPPMEFVTLFMYRLDLTLDRG